MALLASRILSVHLIVTISNLFLSKKRSFKFTLPVYQELDESYYNVLRIEMTKYNKLDFSAGRSRTLMSHIQKWE